METWTGRRRKVKGLELDSKNFEKVLLTKCDKPQNGLGEGEQLFKANVSDPQNKWYSSK